VAYGEKKARKACAGLQEGERWCHGPSAPVQNLLKSHSLSWDEKTKNLDKNYADSIAAAARVDGKRKKCGRKGCEDRERGCEKPLSVSGEKSS